MTGIWSGDILLPDQTAIKGTALFQFFLVAGSR
jgi:hypothetical protein